MILRLGLLRPVRIYCNSIAQYSRKPDSCVFFTNNIGVCWHPEPEFPYDCSKPLPEAKCAPESVLKVTEQEAYKLWSKDKHRCVIADELAALTHTNKHIWFPRARDKRAKKTKPDRPYL